MDWIRFEKKKQLLKKKRNQLIMLNVKLKILFSYFNGLFVIQ